MDPIVREFINSGGHKHLQMGSNLKFACSCCGSCCKKSVTTLVTGHDFYRICKHFREDTEAVFNKYFILGTLGSTNTPIMSFKLNRDECIFLDGNNCSIYTVRPFVCRLYPVGVQPDLEGNLVFYLNKACAEPGTGPDISLSRWLKSHASKLELEYQKVYWKLVVDIIQVEKSMEADGQTAGEETLQLLYGHIFSLIYLHYDDTTDFLKQFRDNAKIATMAIRHVAQFGELPAGMKM